MKRVNNFVSGLLRSPAHRLLSGRILLLSYRGRRSGRVHSLPVGYRREGARLVITVARPETKRWWRNFEQPRPVELRLRGRRMAGVAVLAEHGETHRVVVSDLRP